MRTQIGIIGAGPGGLMLARLYLRCDADDDIENWPDSRIWDELHKRLPASRTLKECKMPQKGITPMRSFVVEAMQYGKLFLAGDSAYIVLPTRRQGHEPRIRRRGAARARSKRSTRRTVTSGWNAIRPPACAASGTRSASLRG